MHLRAAAAVEDHVNLVSMGKLSRMGLHKPIEVFRRVGP